MANIKTAVVVVTYNRLELLKENIKSILAQSEECDILIVDNASTDGTKQYLESLDSKRIKVYHLEKNLGGAGGFSYGLKVAICLGYKYSWLMDDDSIPEKDALKSLCKKAISIDNKFSFMASLVYWIDGNLFPMNTPFVSMGEREEINRERLDFLSNKKLIEIERCSFVGCFVNNEVAKKTYLPIKEFFIYGDDFEYTSRLSKIEKAFLDIDSKIEHRAPSNQGARIAYVPADRIDRFFYQSRNAMYISRKNGFLAVLKNTFETVGRSVRILFISKDNKFKRIKVVLSGYIAGIRFNPLLEMYDKK